MFRWMAEQPTGWTRRRLPVALLLIALVTAACGPRHEFVGLLFDDPQPAAEITGVNYDGTPFALSDLQGQVTLLFFGYTSCPDICPFTLVELADAYKQLAAESPKLVEDLNVVFVSVDPERDTPERLAQYIPNFHPDFYGVHVEPEELARVKAAYGIYAEKREVDPNASAGGYFIDHTASISLIDRSGKVAALFQHDTPASDLAADLKVLLKR